MLMSKGIEVSSYLLPGEKILVYDHKQYLELREYEVGMGKHGADRLSEPKAGTFRGDFVLTDRRVFLASDNYPAEFQGRQVPLPECEIFLNATDARRAIIEQRSVEEAFESKSRAFTRPEEYAIPGFMKVKAIVEAGLVESTGWPHRTGGVWMKAQSMTIAWGDPTTKPKGLFSRFTHPKPKRVLEYRTFNLSKEVLGTTSYDALVQQLSPLATAMGPELDALWSVASDPTIKA